MSASFHARQLPRSGPAGRTRGPEPCQATRGSAERRAASARRTVAMPGRREDVYTGAPVPQLEQSVAQLRGVGAVGASVALALALASLPHSVTEALLDSAAEFAKHFAIGGFSAAVGTAVVYPLDLLKTRMQVEPNRWASALSCGAECVKDGGVRSLYAGVGANLLGVAPEKSLKIMAYTACHTALLGGLVPQPAELPLMLEALAGAAAGAAQSFISCPIEAAKIPLQVAGGNGGSGEQLKLSAIVSSLGWAGMFRGLDVCLARDMLTSAIFFSAFAWAKHVLADGADVSGMHPSVFLVKLAAGGLAGIPAALVTTPLDVVKTRLQAQSEASGGGEGGEEGKAKIASEDLAAAGRDTSPYLGSLDCAVRTVREEGWGALWCGAGERVARLSPQLGISLALYEILDPIR